MNFAIYNATMSLYSIIFCQLLSTFLSLRDLLFTFVDFPCILEIWVNFRHLFVNPRVLPLIFRESVRLSDNFQQLFVRPRDILSTSINIPCVHLTFHQPSVHPWELSMRPWDFPSSSFKFSSLCGTFSQLLTISVHPLDF